MSEMYKKVLQVFAMLLIAFGLAAGAVNVAGAQDGVIVEHEDVSIDTTGDTVIVDTGDDDGADGGDDGSDDGDDDGSDDGDDGGDDGSDDDDGDPTFLDGLVAFLTLLLASVLD